MADIKFAFVACAFLSCLIFSECAQQYEVENFKSQVNNWQPTRSRLRDRGATRSVATSPYETLDNSSPDITTRSRQRIRDRYIPEPVGEEQYRYKAPQDLTVDRSLNFKSRTNIKTLEDSLNTERYQKRLEVSQRRNGLVETTDIPFSRNHDDVGKSAKRLERVRNRIVKERGSDDATSFESRPRSRGRTVYQDTTVEGLTPESKFSRSKGFTSRYQNVESTEPTRRENMAQTVQVKQEPWTVTTGEKYHQTNQPQMIASALWPQTFENIPVVKPQQVDTVFPNLSTQKFSTDPAQQFSRRSDTSAASIDFVSNPEPDSKDAERTTQFIPFQTQKGRNRGRTTYQTAQEITPDPITQSKSRTRQGSFRSRTRVIETTTPSTPPSSRPRTNSQTRNTPRTFRGRSWVEGEQQASDRVFTDNLQSESPKPDSLSRNTAKETKSADEIDETDNYPKEFLEKLKKSKTYTSSSKITYRSKRRQYPTTTVATIVTTTKSGADASETNTKETDEESTVQTDRYSQRFYKNLSQRAEESRQESTTSEGTKSPTGERRKFVPKKKLTAEERKERILRLKEKLRKNATEEELKVAESKESIVRESLVTQANTHPGSREVFPTENVKSTVEVKSSVSSNIKRVKKPRGKVRFRDDSRDLIPLGSEEQIVVVKNETTTKKPEVTRKPTTTKKPPSTTRLPQTVATTQGVTSTTKDDFAVLVSEQKGGVVVDMHGHTVQMFQNVTLFPSTRHRFSARINSSATFNLPPDVELVTTTAPLTALTTPEVFSSFERKPELILSVNKLFNTSVTSTNSSTSTTTSTTSSTTARTTTRRSNSKKKSSGKKKTKKSKTSRTTTKKPKSSISSTTTVRPASNSTGVRPLTLAFSDIQTIINETMKIVNNNSMTGPSPGVVPRSELNALTPETILNETTEATMGTGGAPTTTARANTNSSVNSTNKIEPSAKLTELECSNGSCTKSKSQSLHFNEDNSNREPIPYARQKGTTKSPESLRKIFIYGVFPNNTVQRKPFPGDGDRSPARLYSRPTTSLPQYTSGDYDVFGIYPNNSVVRRRGWKTFDYEKYHSPYVIFGIYPNNTIIKKFPNGTTINDRFMVSDNEIYKSDGKIYCTCADPGHRGVTPHMPLINTTTTSTSTTTTTTSTTSTTITTQEPEAEEEEEEEEEKDEEEKEEEEKDEEEKEEEEKDEEEKEEEEEENEEPDRNPKEEVENVDIELESISETEKATEQTTEESTDVPLPEITQTTIGTLEEAEEADLVLTTTEPNRLENAEEVDDSSTPRNFEDPPSNSLEREETQNQGLEDVEEADSKESDNLSDAENADIRTTERNDGVEGNLEERTKENEKLQEGINQSLREDTTDRNENEKERTTEPSTNDEEGTQKSEDLEEGRKDVTSDRSENIEEKTTASYYEESTTESNSPPEKRTGNYLTQPKSEKSESLKELLEDNSTDKSERLEERSTTVRSENLEEDSLFGTTQRSANPNDFGTTEKSEEYEELIGGQFYEPRENDLTEQAEEFETTEESEGLKEQTEEHYFDARTTERSQKLYERTDGYELTTESSERPEERATERSENIEEQTTPRPLEDSTEESNKIVEEQKLAEERLNEKYEELKTTEKTIEITTNERSERPRSQEAGTEPAFLGDLVSTESPETIQTTQKPSAQQLESAQIEGNFDLIDRMTTQIDKEKVAADDARETGSLLSLTAATQRPGENTIPVKVIYEENYRITTETTPQRIAEMTSEDLREAGILKNLATTLRPDENTIPVKVIYDGYTYDEPTGKPFIFEDVFAKDNYLVGNKKAATLPAAETSTEDIAESATADYEIYVRELGNLISRLTTSAFGETTPPMDTTEAATSRKETIDLLDASLPLSIEYIQSSASGNAVKKRHRKSVDDLDEPSSLTNLAYRSLSSSETTSTPISKLTTTRTTTTKVSLSTSATRFKPKKLKNYSKTSVTAYKHLTNLTSTPRPDDVFIVTPVGSAKENSDADYLKRGKVKFVTLTPGVVVTTNIHDENDILTMSSQHVQKVTKAPAKIPDNFLSTVFGELEEKASSPIPDILKNVENDLHGDGLSASLARRIITLALEKAMTSTTPVAPITSPSSATTTTVNPLTTTGTFNQQSTLAPTLVTTLEPKSTTRKETTTRKPTTTRGPPATTPAKSTTTKALTSTTRRPRTTSTTTTTTTTTTPTTTMTSSATEQTREILITPKKAQGQVTRRPAPLITSPEFLQSTIGPEIGDGRTAVEVPAALEPLNVLFASDKLPSTTTAAPGNPKPTDDLNAILSGLFPEPTPSSSKASEYSNLVTQRSKSTKKKASLSKQASASLSESDLKILEAILQQQGANGGGQDLEQIVQNQIRLAEEVRKASRNLRKKPRTTTSTTTERPTPLGLGFLLNLFGSGSRPNGPGLFANEAKNFRRQRPTTPSTFITLTNTSQVTPDPFNELDGEDSATGERSVRGELVSAAIDVTKAVSKFMGTVLSSAAQSFQNFFRNLGR